MRGHDTPHCLQLVASNGMFVDDIEYLSPYGKSDHVVLVKKVYFFLAQSNTLRNIIIRAVTIPVYVQY
jgi:hypothetical protein